MRGLKCLRSIALAGAGCNLGATSAAVRVAASLAQVPFTKQDSRIGRHSLLRPAAGAFRACSNVVNRYHPTPLMGACRLADHHHFPPGGACGRLEHHDAWSAIAMPDFLNKTCHRRIWIMGLASTLALTAALLWLTGQEPVPSASKPAAVPCTVPHAGPAAGTPASPVPPATAAPLSEAEQLARLRRSIETARKELAVIQDQLAAPDGEYEAAAADFAALDAQRTEIKKAIAALKPEQHASDIAHRTEELKTIEERWQRARERCNLAIAERKTLQAKVAALQQKVEQDQQALQRLTSQPAAAAAPLVGPPTAAGDGKPTAPPAALAPAAPPAAAAGSTPAPVTASATDPAPVAPAAAAPAPAIGPPAPAKPPTQDLLKARADAHTKQAATQQAQEKAQAIDERVKSLRTTIELEKKLLDNSGQKATHAQKSQTQLEENVQRNLMDNPIELDGLRQEMARTGEALRQAEDQARLSADRLNDLHAEMRHLEEERAAAAQEAEQNRLEAEKAAATVARMENPFAPRNVLAWLWERLPRLLIITLGMLVLYGTVRVFGQRAVQLMVRTGERGSEEDRQNRAQTLVGVFRNTASMLTLGGGTLMLLDALTIPILPLMGGAAVFGLAVAFGAQNLIRDYFSGFMVLLEDQYGINDVVKIGDTSGLVEKITLRVTVLRDMAGVVHFVPHGTISTVSNLTHGWSRAFFDIGVAYREDVDRVMKVLVDLANELRLDPDFNGLILDDPEMLGVDAFADSGVVIKFFIKTKPLQQWKVRRELLRRIKHRFDRLGIEIPFPHRTVYHRYEADADGATEPGPRQRGLVA